MAWIVALMDEAEFDRIKALGHEIEPIEPEQYAEFFDCTVREQDARNPKHFARLWIDCSAEDLLKN